MSHQSKIFGLCSMDVITHFTDMVKAEKGILTFKRNGTNFFFQWDFDENVHLVDLSSSHINLNSLSEIIITENPIELILVPKNKKEPIVFKVSNKEILSLSIMLECLIRNLAVCPHPTKSKTLIINQKAHYDTSDFIPPNIYIDFESSDQISQLWDHLLDYYQELMIFSFEARILPSSYSHLLSYSAQCFNNRVLKEIDEDISKWPIYDPITLSEFDSLFDSNGKIINPSDFNLRLFHGGAEDNLTTSLIPFAVGLYPLGSTLNERQEINEHLIAEFNSLKTQTESILPEQVSSNFKIREAFRVINQDVDRTDRTLEPFKKKDGTAHSILRHLLKQYTIFSPTLSYMQGMNDIFVPIMLAYLPKWVDGNPVDDNDQPLDAEPILPLMFGCFDALINKTKQSNLFINIQKQWQVVTDQIMKLLNKISPMVYIWFNNIGLSEIKNLIFIYSDYLIMFKRTYQDIWPLWFQFLSMPEPSYSLIFYVTAFLLQSFSQLSDINDISQEKVMSSFPSILLSLDRSKVMKIAYWICEKNKEWQILPKNIEKTKHEQSLIFDFFEPYFF